jgi:Asp-tRNA(Asn)/Glu-tRNA(Gln) amidotransferase A subunit family amidase
MKLFAGPAATYVDTLYQHRIDEAGEFVRRVLKSHHERHAPTVAEQYAAKTEVEDARSELLRFLLRFDLLVAPVGSVNAFRHNSRKLSVGNSTVGVFKAFGYSQAANVFGLPSLALPVGRDSSGLPVGVQLIGSPFSDLRLLTVAEFLERELGGCVPVLS